jgi:hypothetical protein
MKVAKVPVGALVVDSLPFSEGGTLAQAQAFRAAGVRGLVGYLGAMNAARLAALHQAGLGFMPITFGGPNAFDGVRALAEVQALGLPSGATVWLDIEGPAVFAMGAKVFGLASAWAEPLNAAHYITGAYFGSPQPLTSGEAFMLPVFRYWHGIGSARDRTGALVEPSCGWCMQQAFPSITIGGVSVDANLVGEDFKGRVPTWVVGD